MKRFFLFSCFLALMFLVGCQPELDYDLGPEVIPEEGTDVPGGQLVKLQEDWVHDNGIKESNIQSFSWDTNKRLKEYTKIGIENGSPVSVRYRFTRATDGKLTRFVEDGMGAGNFPFDSIVQKLTYQPGTAKLAYSIITSYPSRQIDSLVFGYNPAGKINQKELFFRDGSNGMQPLQKDIYNYDTKGNLTAQITYATDPSSGYLPDATHMNYTYGTHKASITLPGEDIFIASRLAECVSPNYLTRASQIYKNVTLTESDYSKETKFTSDDRPRSGKIYSAGRSSNFSCTYQ